MERKPSSALTALAAAMAMSAPTPGKQNRGVHDVLPLTEKQLRKRSAAKKQRAARKVTRAHK